MVGNGRFRSSVFRPLCAAALCAMLAASCSIFAANPFPDYLSGIEKKIDISSRISSVLGSATTANYAIAAVDTPGGERILVQIVPFVAEPTAGSPGPKLLVFSRTLDYLGMVIPASPLAQIFRPCGYTADSKILSGTVVFDPDTLSVVQMLPTTGLSGFAFSVAPNTYILSMPVGQSSSFTLTIGSYNSLWTPLPDQTVDIVSPANQTGSGYRLEGARLTLPDTVTVTLRNVDTDELLTAQASLTALAGGSAPALLETGTITSIDGHEATVYYTDNDIVLRRASGVFERYTADGASMTKSATAETGTDPGIVYGFSKDGAYVYRLNPVSGSFSLIRNWW